MAILQISKIQHRSGNLVDLPQLDEAEFGWANDAKRLFIGKTSPNENVEILTSYSKITFGQIDGSVGNLNISAVDIANGQILAFDGTNWVNKGGDAGGLITLGDVSNVKLGGGAVGYVLQTDGTGNLSWAPKGTLVSGVLNVSKTNPAVVTTVSDNFFSLGGQVSILDPQGMTQLAGNIYFADVLTTTTFALYSDSTLETPVDATGFTEYSYTTVSATTLSNSAITVANADVFSTDQAVRFVGDMSTSGIENNVTYYVITASGNELKVSDTVGGNLVQLQTVLGLSAEVYAVDGQAVSSTSSGVTFSTAGGANTNLQFNDNGSLQGSPALSFDFAANILTLNGNANVGNLNSTSSVVASVLVSNITNGTPPLTVSSSTRVPNLYATRANIADQSTITNQTTGTFYPVLVSSSATGNRALGANANISFNAATGNLSVTLLDVSSNANVGNLVTSQVLATANVIAPQLISNVATGTAPFVVSSNTVVANLNADLLKGFSTATAATPNTIVVRDNNGSITGNLLTGTLITAAQPNITSVGTLTSLGVTGNLAAGNISTTGNLGVSGNVTLSGSNISLGPIGNIKISGGTSGFVVITDGSGNLSFVNPVTVGTQPAGSNTQIQYNAGGTLGASANFTFNEVTNKLTVTGEVSGSRLTSTVATGTAPLSVNSTTQVANLNAATAGTVTNAAQPNITSLGTLLNLLVTGSVTAANGIFTNVSGNGAALSSINGANVTGKAANAVYADSAGSVPWTGVSGRPVNVSAFVNDAGYITAAQTGIFPTGTRMLFAQTTAPLGWTKDTSTSLNDAALRVVTGSAGTGGSVNFSAAFTSQAVTGSVSSTTASGTVSGTSVSGTIGSTTAIGTIDFTATSGTVGDTALTLAQIPPHTHSIPQYVVDAVDDGGSAPYAVRYNYSSTTTGSAGSGQAHSHTFTGSSHTHNFTGTSHTHTFSSPSHSHTFSGSAHTHGFTGDSINLEVKYVDIIIATRN